MHTQILNKVLLPPLFSLHIQRKSTLKDRYKHLTNFSVNKKSEQFIKNVNANEDQVGNKWSLKALFKKYKELGIDGTKILEKIKDIIVKTLIAVETPM